MDATVPAHKCATCDNVLTIPQVRQNATRCKACKALLIREKRKERYALDKADPERYAAIRALANQHDRKRYQSPERRAKQREYTVAWMERNGITRFSPSELADRRIARLKETSCPIPWCSCAWCGKGFIASGPRRVYCSDAHAEQVRRAKPEKIFWCACGAVTMRPNTPYCAQCSSEAKRNRKRREKQSRKARLLSIVREPYTLREIAARDGHRCQIPDCLHPRTRIIDMTLRVPHDWAATIDHIVPTSPRVGGDDTRANVQLAHNKCNWTKQDGGWQQLRLVG